MARYTVTENGSKTREDPLGNWIGWDTLSGRSTEARHAGNLNAPLPKSAKDQFKKMGPGETLNTGRFTMFREW